MKKWLFCFLFFSAGSVRSQDSARQAFASPAAAHPARKWLVGAGTAAGYGGSFVLLNQAWYKGYPRSGFHTFNDNGEWYQVDKMGHSWTTYQTSRAATAFWKWAGLPTKKAVFYGAGSSLLFTLSIEYLDGRSAEWGWSWGDVTANVFGAALFASQEMGWRDQRISIKFSSHFNNYSDPVLKARANQLFGASLPERLLKDYNAQTYWLSVNLRSFFAQSTLPDWLNVAVGAGADGMFGGYENVARSKTDGSITFDRRDVKRLRQWYLAPDVDFSRIKTRSRFLKTMFSALNVLKCPSPALEFSAGRPKLKLVVF